MQPLALTLKYSFAGRRAQRWRRLRSGFLRRLLKQRYISIQFR
jgi:hypothetical protein